MRLLNVQQIRVLCSGSFIHAFQTILPGLQSETHLAVTATAARSIGSSKESIPSRLQRGEAFDLVLCFDEAADRLVGEGLLLASSKVTIAESFLAMAVKQGSVVPGLDTIEQLRDALISAQSIAYSASASGIYFQSQLLPRLGLAEAVQGRCRLIENEPVGNVIARGECDLGLQQMSELVPCKGVTVVRSFPEECQKVTTIAAAVSTATLHPEAARQIILYLISAHITDTFLACGLRPVVRPA